MARNVEEKRRQSVWHDGILRGGTGRNGQMLRESFHQRDAERPDVAGRRDDSLRDFWRIVRARMARGRGGRAVLRVSGGHMRLLGVPGDGENAVARQLELIFDGENVRGPHMSMEQTLAMEERERLQRGRENVARFRGCERALRKKL